MITATRLEIRVRPRELTIAVLAALLCGLFYSLTLRDGHTWGDDFAQYIVHARNMVQGRPYAMFPWIRTLDLSYPPGFPLLLTVPFSLLGVDISAMKLLNVCLFTAALVALFLFARKNLRFRYALALLLIIGFNPFFWEFKDNILSDIPFLLFVMLSLLSLNLMVSQPSNRLQIGDVAIASASVLAAFSMRNAGIVLLAVPILTDLAHFKKVSKNSIAFTGICAAGIYAITRIFMHGHGYFAFTGDILSQSRLWLDHARNYVSDCSMIWDNTKSRVAYYVLATLMGLFTLVGMTGRFRQQRFGVGEGFVLLYVPLIICWPFYQGIRFCIPIIPLLVMYILSAVSKIENGIDKRVRGASWRHMPLVALLIIIGTTYALKYSNKSLWRISDNSYSQESLEMADWIKVNVPENGRIAFRKPRALALLTGKLTTLYNLQPGDNAQLEFLRSAHVSFVAYGTVFEDDETILKPCIAAHPELFTKVFGNRDFTVVRMENR